MGFGFQKTSGEFKAHLRYDARAGKLFRPDKVAAANGWETNLTDITATAMFVADLENVRVGYINYTAQGPVKALGPVGHIPERPEGLDERGKPAFKEAFELDVILHPSCGNPHAKEGVREFSSTAGIVRDAVEELYDRYLGTPERAEGKLPIIRLDPDVPAMPVKTGFGGNSSTNYKPRFVVVGWVDRPPLLAIPMAPENVLDIPPPRSPAAANGGALPKTSPVPPATGGQRVTAPLKAALQASLAVTPAKAQPSPALISADDFG